LRAVEAEVVTIQIEVGKIDTEDTEVQKILETDGQEGTSGGHNCQSDFAYYRSRQALKAATVHENDAPELG
jgi:hypothetical protein